MDADDASGRECAICLAIPDVLDVARVDACLHAFHARCLARWATFTSPGTKTRCPVCKVPFAHALTRRGLDGTPRASFREEPMCLLVRARWCGDADGAEEDPGEESESDVDADDADADAADAAEALAGAGVSEMMQMLHHWHSCAECAGEGLKLWSGCRS